MSSWCWPVTASLTFLITIRWSASCVRPTTLSTPPACSPSPPLPPGPSITSRLWSSRCAATSLGRWTPPPQPSRRGQAGWPAARQPGRGRPPPPPPTQLRAPPAPARLHAPPAALLRGQSRILSLKRRRRPSAPCAAGAHRQGTPRRGLRRGRPLQWTAWRCRSAERPPSPPGRRPRGTLPGCRAAWQQRGGQVPHGRYALTRGTGSLRLWKAVETAAGASPPCRF
mmetsp:Transcript_15094/g.47981  ORF Transcript_15094/g.47981 Transcript_15094/m.47981 type:complete len:226 (-) Transcript_15094:451-1128(-)